VLALLLLVAAAAPPTLPHIHETFTPLPCPKQPVSTLDLVGCAERDILRTDKTVEAKERKVFALLHDVDGRRAFVSAERSWLAYRRSICAAEASKFAGGTLAGVVAASCTARQNRRHLTDLSALARTLKQP
jgi:uncharacterized protein YecT (DUF1311 family)